MEPMAGPPRATFKITAGTSQAQMWEMPSCIREMPRPEELVIARPPAAPAPNSMFTEASSLSACLYTPPTWGSRQDMYSGTSFWGVMG